MLFWYQIWLIGRFEETSEFYAGFTHIPMLLAKQTRDTLLTRATLAASRVQVASFAKSTPSDDASVNLTSLHFEQRKANRTWLSGCHTLQLHRSCSRDSYCKSSGSNGAKFRTSVGRDMFVSSQHSQRDCPQTSQTLADVKNDAPNIPDRTMKR